MEAASRVAAARQLALTAATGEVLDAMADAGIRTVVLKGPAIAARLYEQPELRPAVDVDLLVAPSQARAAAEVLTRLGFRDPMSGARSHERAAHAVSYRRDDGLPTRVDLHTALALCASDPEALWAEFSGATTSIRIAGRPTDVLADHAQAFVLAVHALQHGPETKPREDLRRGLGTYDGTAWEKAAALAKRLDAEAVFAAGLRLSEAGTILADNLLTTVESDSIEIRLRRAGAPTGAFGLLRFSRTRSTRDRLRFVLDELVPTQPLMRHAYPFAARGRAALTLAYVYHPFALAARLPGALIAWRRAGGSPRRVSAFTPGNAVGARWAWRAASRARQQLQDGGLHALALPPPPAPATWRGVGIVLHRRNLTCLERAAVRQCWHSAHGSSRDLIVGVSTNGDGFVMHAWLEGDRDAQLASFSELVRHQPIMGSRWIAVDE